MSETDDSVPIMSEGVDGDEQGGNNLSDIKRAFTEVVSHELNTPVAIILGYTSLLSRHLPEEVKDGELAGRALEGMKLAARRLESISERIFKILSEEGRVAQLQLSTVEVERLVHNVHDQVAGFLDERHQSLEINIDEDVTDELQADPEKLQDILVNLMVNAIKFSRDEQSIELVVRRPTRDETERLEAESDGRASCLCFVIKDAGTGIEPEDIDQVFDAFFSTMQSRNHSSGEFGYRKRGIGLGLPVAQHFARMHGGDIVVESESGKGSTFTVVLPTRRDDD